MPTYPHMLNINLVPRANGVCMCVCVYVYDGGNDGFKVFFFVPEFLSISDLNVYLKISN